MPGDDSCFFRGWLDASITSMEMFLKSLDAATEIEDLASETGFLNQDDQRRITKLSQALASAASNHARRSRGETVTRKMTKSDSVNSFGSSMPMNVRHDLGWFMGSSKVSSRHRRPSFLDQALSNQPRQLVRAIKDKIRPNQDGVNQLLRVQTMPAPGHWAETPQRTPHMTPCGSVLPSPRASSNIDAFCLRGGGDDTDSRPSNTHINSDFTLDMDTSRKKRLSVASLRSTPSVHRLDKVAVQIIQDTLPRNRLRRTRSTVNLDMKSVFRIRCSRGDLISISTLAAFVAMLYSIIMTPVVVCLGGTPSIVESIVEVLCEVALLSTIAAPFLLGTDDPEKKVQLITSCRGVLNVYGRGWLCFDVMSLWPWHVTWLVAGSDSSAKCLLYLSICRLLKFPRLMTSVQLHVHWMRRFHLSLHPNVHRAVRLIAFYFFVVHVAACGYYAVGTSYEGQWTIYAKDRSSTIVKWGQAFYWALCAVLGENMDPVSDEEIAYSSSILALGVLLNSCIIGSITSLLGSLDERAAKRKSKLDTINTFMERSGVDSDLCDQVQQYYKYLHSSVSRDGGLFDDLSSSLRLKIDLCIHKKFIGACNIFASCTPECIAALVTIISRNSVIYVPTELIFRKGDKGDGMYFVVKGEVVLFNPGEDLEDLEMDELEAMQRGELVGDATLFGKLHHGDSFGELALILANSTRNLTAAAFTFLELLCLPKRDFENVLCLYPTFADKIKEMVEHYVGDSAERSMSAMNLAQMTRMTEAQLSRLSEAQQLEAEAQQLEEEEMNERSLL